MVGKKTWEDMDKAALDKNLANLSGGPGCGVGGHKMVQQRLDVDSNFEQDRIKLFSLVAGE